MIQILISCLSSAIGSLITWVIIIHFDVEGWWEQQRLRKGKKLDARQRRAAEEHGKS